MKTFLSILLLAGFSFCSNVNKTHSSTPKEGGGGLNKLIRPFLDSLRVVPVESSGSDQAMFCLESVYPASRVNDSRFDDFTTEGKLVDFIPPNDRLSGLLTEGISLFDNNRIGFTYSFINNDKGKLFLKNEYKFVSSSETSPSGEKLIRQSLYLTLKEDIPFSQIWIGLLEAQVYQQFSERPVEIGKPVYRNITFGSRSEDVHYMSKNSDGIYSLIDFTEGSDRTFPEYANNGQTGLFVFFIKNMKYPKEALEQKKEATVLVSAEIDEKGKIKETEIMTNTEDFFNKEAIRLVKLSSGKWKPATRNGENIPDTQMIPVSFKLEYAQ